VGAPHTWKPSTAGAIYSFKIGSFPLCQRQIITKSGWPSRRAGPPRKGERLLIRDHRMSGSKPEDVIVTEVVFWHVMAGRESATVYFIRAAYV
jgi:hypothetical protein